jgi:alditol oxidase
VPEVNWAGNVTYRAGRVHRPATLDELRAIVAAAPRIRVLGTRHSFSDIPDSSELLELGALPAEIAIDRAARTVTLAAGLTYGAVAPALRAAGLALHNLASLPHISVGGAIATATHGSGVRSGNLATAVAALELVTCDGDVVRLARGDADFDGIVVGLGALGAVTRVTLDAEPGYDVRQRVFTGLGWDALFEHFDAIAAGADSVSVFTRWDERAGDVWLKQRVTGAPEQVAAELYGAPAATAERHPIPGLDPVNCTPQLGVPGPWYDRLPHFRMGFTPSSGAEIQSEYFVRRDHGVAAVRALRDQAAAIRPVLQVSELRTQAADRLWLSPQHGQDTLSIHFTWRREPAAVARALAVVEAALAPFGARPHWGKAFLMAADAIAPSYVRLGDFAALAGRLDARGAFRNDWLQRSILPIGA